MNYNKKQLKGEFFTEDKNIINKLLNTLKISGNIFNY